MYTIKEGKVKELFKKKKNIWVLSCCYIFFYIGLQSHGTCDLLIEYSEYIKIEQYPVKLTMEVRQNMIGTYKSYPTTNTHPM